jgi:hypothetical protein
VDYGPYLITDARAARLTRDEHIVPQVSQTIRQELDLRRFATAVRPFDRNEQAHHFSR